MVTFNKEFLNKQIEKLRDSPTLSLDKTMKDKVAKGETVYNFSVGQAAEPTPDYIYNDLISRLADPKVRKELSIYSPVAGSNSLKKAVAAKFETENGITYTPDEIIVSNGGKQAIFNAFAVTLQPGDKAIVPDPSWVSYADMVRWKGAEVVPLKTNGDFKFTADALKKTLDADQDNKIKWIVLNSPSNPTSACYTREELERIADVVIAENKSRAARSVPPVMVMSDDIYEHMVYEKDYLNKENDASAVSYNIIMANPEIKPYTLIINGVAKAFAMTGWRVGYAAGPKELIAAMGKFQGLSTSGVSAISQLAAEIALSPEKKEQREAFFTSQRKKYTERRGEVDRLIKEIPGLRYDSMPGAFYAFIDCSGLLDKTTQDGTTLKTSADLSKYLLDQYGVGMVPGDDFNADPKKRQEKSYLRMSFATSLETIQKGLAAVKQFVTQNFPDLGRGEARSA